jgi:hypothetical protein
MRFICLGYIEANKWESLPEKDRNSMMEQCFEYDDQLRKGGHFVGGEALQNANTAATLRWQRDKVVVTDGPYAETKEQLGGILLLEANNMEHAIALMSKHPGVRLGGPFEIRPAAAEINELVAARDRAAAKAQ